jgi:hypothetical protein
LKLNFNFLVSWLWVVIYHPGASDKGEKERVITAWYVRNSYQVLGDQPYHQTLLFQKLLVSHRPISTIGYSKAPFLASGKWVVFGLSYRLDYALTT